MNEEAIMEHTPRPWKRVSVKGGWDGVGSDQGLICKLSLNNPANAQLISAAPDLLEACKEVYKDQTTGYEERYYLSEEVLRNVKEAIAKAE